MYICICNGFKDKDLARAVTAGSCCTASAFSYLGGEPQCGQCVSTAEALIEDLSLGDPGGAPAPEVSHDESASPAHSAASLCSCT